MTTRAVAPRWRLASQWGEAFDARLRAARPDVLVHSLPAREPPAVPPATEVLLGFPFIGQPLDTPAPPDWPGTLRWIQLISVGVDRYPRWIFEGPPVSTAHGSSSETIADFALACVLHHALRLPARRARQAADWRPTAAPALAGSRLGLYGFGGIGQALARRALALGLEVRALRRSDAPLGMDGVSRAADLEDLLAWSDHLVLVAPATPSNRHAIDARTLAVARPGLHLVNVARGSLIDQDALRAALDDGRLGWASLDVTEPEPLPDGHWLYAHPKISLTPHTCAHSPQVQDALLDKVLRGLASLERGETPADLADLARGYALSASYARRPASRG